MFSSFAQIATALSFLMLAPISLPEVSRPSWSERGHRCASASHQHRADTVVVDERNATESGSVSSTIQILTYGP